MNATPISPNVTLAEPPTRHVTDHIIYEQTSACSLATYSASEPAREAPSKEVPKRKPRSPKSAAHQADYHKQWRKTERGRAALVAASKRWAERYPERARAHRLVAEAVRLKRLVKGACELGGSDCKGRIEAHHDDYSRPLDVRWACRRHHEQLDCERRTPELASGCAAPGGTAPLQSREAVDARFVEDGNAKLEQQVAR